jgi:hypothetical protein
MGYIEEPKNVDFVVGPSVLTEEAKNAISSAIAQFHKTGKTPVNINSVTKKQTKSNTKLKVKA